MDEEDYILPQGASFNKIRHTPQSTEQGNTQNKTFSDTFGKWISDNMVTIMIGTLVIILGILLYYWFTRSEPEVPKEKGPPVKIQKQRQQQQAATNNNVTGGLDEEDMVEPVVDIPEDKPQAKRPMKRMTQDRPVLTENKSTNTIKWDKLRQQREEEQKRRHTAPIVEEEEEEQEEEYDEDVQVEYEE